MNNKKIVVLIAAVLLIFVVWKSGVLDRGDKNTPSPAQPSNGEESTPGAFKHSVLGFSFTYDPQIFTVTQTPDGAVAMSQYYVLDNPSGIPANERKHPFSVTIEVANTDTLSYIKALPYGNTFMSVFPGGTLESFTGEGGFAEKVTIDGKVVHRFTLGLEGTNVDYYFVNLGANKTGIITVSYFTDFLAHAVKPAPFSEEKERKAVQIILDSLTF